MNGERLQLDQCLFGYEDGHRLLESSLELGADASYLTQLSDLAPGVVFGDSDGYWTGMPVPGLRRYALMRTWPAPEMPRPGCVWTHALLIRPKLFELVDDLTALEPLFARPKHRAVAGRYRAQIDLGSRPPSARPAPSDACRDLIVRLIEALYGDLPSPVEIAKPGELDAAIFSVWSQQWPRLRRNFRFQTAALREPRSAGSTKFDAASVIASSRAGRAAVELQERAWVAAAAQDASDLVGGDLRRFLWRYGADVRRQRGSFRPLAEIKLLGDVGENVAKDVLRLVTDNFPDREDATRLKQDLIDGELVPDAQLEIMWYVLADGGEAVFPAPSHAGIARLALLWPHRPHDLLQLAERTTDAQDELGRSIFATIASAVPATGFWKLIGPYPGVCQRMVGSRPELLLADDALDVGDRVITRLIAAVTDAPEVIEALLPKLLLRDDADLAAAVLDGYPRIAAAQIVSAVDSGGVRVGRSWLRALIARPEVLLDPQVMRQITRTSMLYDLAEALGWLSHAVRAAGTEPWIAALVDVTSDLPDDRRDLLRSFLVALALSSGGDGGRRILEKFFGAVHEREMKSRLPWRAKELLSPYLPELGWSRSWDYALRLRLAAAVAYVRHGYPVESYAKLVSSRKGRSLMADAASSVEGGNSYAQAARP